MDFSPDTYAIFRHLSVIPRSKHDLARLTGLSLQSIGQRIRGLEKQHMIECTNKLYFLSERGIDAMNNTTHAHP